MQFWLNSELKEYHIDTYKILEDKKLYMAHGVYILTTMKMACEWPTNVGGYYIIKLHSYTQVYFLVFLKILYI